MSKLHNKKVYVDYGRNAGDIGTALETDMLGDKEFVWVDFHRTVEVNTGFDEIVEHPDAYWIPIDRVTIVSNL